MKSKKRILITGGTGFIGKYLIEEALGNHFEVYLAIRKNSSIDHLKKYDLNYITLDYSSFESITKSLKTQVFNPYFFDYLIHNAGVKDAVKSEDFYKYNSTLTLDLACAIKSLHLLKYEFIFVSSLAASGPGNENSLENIIEEKHSKPISAYGRSKLLAERHLKSSGLSYLILRPTAVYGNGTKDFDGLVNFLKNRIAIYLGTKDQILSFIHAQDFAKICFRFIQEELNHQTILVSDGKIYTTKQFYKTLATALNSKIMFTFRIPEFILFSLAYIQQKLRIKGPLNSVDKCREVLCVNWKCQGSKLYNTINYEPLHQISEIAAQRD
ncbi:MAG: NAD-dependent epimerase/dehydratase family protein [Flavobacteriales bacterium]